MSLLRKIAGRNKYIVLVTPVPEKELLDSIHNFPRSYTIYARSEASAVEKVATKYYKSVNVPHYIFSVYTEDKYTEIAYNEIVEQAVDKQKEHIDARVYYKRFHLLINTDKLQLEDLVERLNLLNEAEINQIIIDILVDSASFQRRFADWSFDNSLNNVSFFQAAIWHHADSLHNMPSTLEDADRNKDLQYKKKYQITYICHYFSFIKALKELAPSESNKHYLLNLPSPLEEFVNLIKIKEPEEEK